MAEGRKGILGTDRSPAEGGARGTLGEQKALAPSAGQEDCRWAVSVPKALSPLQPQLVSPAAGIEAKPLPTLGFTLCSGR